MASGSVGGGGVEGGGVEGAGVEGGAVLVAVGVGVWLVGSCWRVAGEEGIRAGGFRACRSVVWVGCN